jgi:hypothetical protein
MKKLKTIPYTEYSAQEKQIFTNHFIAKTDNSKHEFEDYINRFYKTLPFPKDDQPYVDPKHSYNAIIKKGIQFDTHRTLWDLNTRDNLVTHFLSQPDFHIDNKSLHRLNFVHPDWNHQNSKGKNALMLLAQRGELSQVEKVIKDFNLDTNAKDRDDKYFTHFMFTVPLLKERPLNLEESRIIIKGVVSFQKINKFLEENPTHLDISPIRLQRIAKEWEQTWENVMNINEENQKKLTPDNVAFVRSHWETVKNKIDKLQFVRALEDDMPTKEVKTPSRKI